MSIVEDQVKYLRSLGVKAAYIANKSDHIGDPSYRGRTNDAFKFGAIARTRKGAWTVISRLFPRSVRST